MSKRRVIALMIVLLAGQADASPAEAIGKFFRKPFKSSAAAKESTEAGKAAKAADGVTGTEALTALDVIGHLPAVNQAAKQFRERCASAEGLPGTYKPPDSACRALEGRSLHIGNTQPLYPSSYLLDVITEPVILRGAKQ